MTTINPILLIDSIDIYKEEKVKSGTGFINGEVEFQLGVPASLGCGEGFIDIFACLPKKRQGRDICVEIAPDIDLGCFEKNIIIDITRNGCPIGKYRVHDVLPIRLAGGSIYSQHLVATQIDG